MLWILDGQMSVFLNDCSHTAEIRFHDRGGRSFRTALFFCQLVSFEKGLMPSHNHPLIQTFIVVDPLHPIKVM